MNYRQYFGACVKFVLLAFFTDSRFYLYCARSREKGDKMKVFPEFNPVKECEMVEYVKAMLHWK